jgi:hypothetical protein
MITKNNFGENVLQYTDAKEALKYLQENQENIEALPQIIFVDIYALNVGIRFSRCL